jgi:hypothetical protein
MNKSINHHNNMYLLNRDVSNSVWRSVYQTVSYSVDSFIHAPIFNAVHNTAYVSIDNSIKSFTREVIKEMYNE